MILTFSIENWMSFRDKVTFSMVAGKKRRHGERVLKLNKYKARILPIAAIYGGNASGKTNFFKALNFAKKLVVESPGQPDNLILSEPFRLDVKGADKPSCFVFELLIDKIIYEFSFAVTHNVVLEEKLTRITSISEKVLYHRRDGEPNFHKSLAKNQFLRFAFKGTRDNQLFLTNSVSQKIDNFRPVYNWFRDTIELITHESRFQMFEKFLEEGDELYSIMNEMLPQLDIGIARIGSRAIPQESDGSQRMIAILPAFLELRRRDSKKVYVIDDLDRSLHTLLARNLLEEYLVNCSTETMTQLLFSTHNMLLMDQQLLRSDEMWATDKDAKGVSRLYPFIEHKDAKRDKDIRKSYLQGRMGSGMPPER